MSDGGGVNRREGRRGSSLWFRCPGVAEEEDEARAWMLFSGEVGRVEKGFRIKDPRLKVKGYSILKT